MAEENCSNCIHAKETPMPGPNGEVLVGKTILVCNRLPPQVTVLPGSAPGQIAITAMFPTVNETMICAEHCSQVAANDVN